MSSRILLFGIVFLITAGSAYAFSITDIFQPILHVLGIYSGEAPVIDSFSVVSQPSGPGEPFTVRLCVVTAPFSPSPSEARFAIDSMDNVVATRSFSPDPSQSITCREYSLTAPATPGNHTVYASVSDASGNWSDWKSAVFYVPGTAHDPKIDQILAPSSVGAGEPFSVQISVSDADGDLSSIYVKIGTFSKYIPVSGYDATETVRIPGMTVGTYILSVTVYDRAGHSDGAERTIRVTLPPNSPPHIDSVSIPSHVYSEQSFTVTVRASDPDGDLRLIGISIPSINYSESREVDGADESASFSVPGLPAGTYTLVAFAQDSVNHRVTKSLQFTVSPEYTGPSVSVSVSPKDVNVGDHVHISARADGENLSKIVVTVNGRSVSVSPPSCRGGEYCAVSADYVPESAGDYRVVATVYDDYGHSASDSTTFTAHARNSSQCTCSPHVSLSVSPTSVDAGDSVLVTVNGYVDHSAGCGSEPLAIKLRVYVDGHVVRTFDCGAPYGSSCTKGPFTFRYTFDSPGDHVVRAQMVWDDCNGATRDDAWSSPVAVRVSGYVPTVTISASRNTVHPGEPVTFTATARADEIRSLDIFVDGVLKKTQNCYMSSSCTVSYTTSFQSGTHEAYAVMRYVVNGSTYSKRSDAVSVRVQQVSHPPVIDSVTCSPSCRVVQGTPLSVTVRASDPDGDLSTAVVAITPKDEPSNTFAWQSKSISSGTATFRFDINYPPGDYVIHVTVTDRAGHEVTASKDLVVVARENMPPVVYVLRGPSVTYVGVPYVVTVCARDQDGNVVRMDAWIDNGQHRVVLVDSADVCREIRLPAPTVVGRHFVHARAMDNGGAWSPTVTRAFTVIARNLPPTARVVPLRTTVSPGATFSYEVCGKDPDGRIVKVAGKVDGQQWVYMLPNPEGCATFRGRAPEKEGNLTIFGKVMDNKGAWSSVATATIRVRYSPPVIVKYTVPARVYAGKKFNVSVTARDPDGDLSGADLVIRDSHGSVVAMAHEAMSGSLTTSVFSASVPTSGEYNVVITVSDRHGLKTSVWQELSAVVLPNAPPIVDSVHIMNTVYAGEPFDVNVCAHDPDGVVEAVQAAVVPGGAVVSHHMGYNGCMVLHFSTPGKDVSPGKYVLSVVAVDNNGARSAPFVVPLVVHARDTVPPSVRILGVTDANVPGHIYVQVSVTDNNSLAEATVYFKVVPSTRWVTVLHRRLSGRSATFTASIPASAPGEYNILVVASDSSGNIGKAYAVGRAFDRIPPAIRIDAPDEVNAGSKFSFSVVVSDNYKVRGISVSVDGNTLFASTSVDSNVWRRSFEYLFHSAGEHRISVVASDYSGNDSSAVHTIVAREADVNAPSVTLLASYHPADHVILWQARAEDPNLRDLNVYVNGTLVRSCVASGATVECNGEWSVPKPGDYVVQAVAEDRFGNVARKSFSVAVPDEPPSVSMVVPAEVPVARPVTLTVVASDDWNLARVAVMGYSIDFNEAVDGRQFTKQFEVVFPREGNYWYSVVAVDSAGHIVEKNVLVSATTAGHKYSLELTPESGSPARVLIAGYVDGSEVNLPCTDVVVNVSRTADSAGIAQYSLSTIVSGGYQICAVVISGPGEYLVTAQWNGVEKSVSVTAYRGVASAPENPVVAVIVALVVLAGLSRII